uniref:Retrotransposon gag domain-containing protein n=1 Tax=Nicotiana tabacum TaxID=4097 RepID=A0A1S3ZHS3_TOBAC|nr:PREDICTED: uncharacterized protein LOC107786995 [Nicotiana tabacum]
MRLSQLLKKFWETLSKGAIIWYHNLPPNSIHSFAMLAYAFVKAHAGIIKVETRKSDLFKVKQRDNEMLREFVSRFQIEQMDMPPEPVKDQSRGRPAGGPSGTIYPNRVNERSKRIMDQEPRLTRDRYQPYSLDRRGNGPGRHPTRNDKRRDQGPSNRGLMSKNGFDISLGPRLSEYNFNVDTWSIVSAIGHIKEIKWRRPLQSDPAQRDHNLIYKYHGTHYHRTEDCR